MRWIQITKTKCRKNKMVLKYLALSHKNSYTQPGQLPGDTPGWQLGGYMHTAALFSYIFQSTYTNTNQIYIYIWYNWFELWHLNILIFNLMWNPLCFCIQAKVLRDHTLMPIEWVSVQVCVQTETCKRLKHTHEHKFVVSTAELAEPCWDPHRLR